ncbi:MULTISPECIES: hypothetical protein [unclassified Brenneria]|uniref:hypothetical protein n=1 Tax=unclassified Brenneria TaxID=2634434 RepID=UPI0018F0B42F|nr:hypothetical protein [Brenneria sp. L3-3C-1]MBJ7223491.1 hypothetical protein [Brenneria sp. L3-3C-1]MEE3644731.1 hypothetical protein [Brenneria sp. L3_3C_1]
MADELLGYPEASHAFTASTVAAYVEDDIFIVALGDDPVQPRSFFIISRPVDSGNNSVDESIELQGHHSEHGQAGALLSITLSPRDLTVRIKPQHVEHFGTAGFTGHFAEGELQVESLDNLERFIRRILDGSQATFTSERAIE